MGTRRDADQDFTFRSRSRLAVSAVPIFIFMRVNFWPRYVVQESKMTKLTKLAVPIDPRS